MGAWMVDASRAHGERGAGRGRTQKDTAEAGMVRDDVKCSCVGNFGPNPDCGRCGGDGCVTIDVGRERTQKDTAMSPLEAASRAMLKAMGYGPDDAVKGVETARAAIIAYLRAEAARKNSGQRNFKDQWEAGILTRLAASLEAL